MSTQPLQGLSQRSNQVCPQCKKMTHRLYYPFCSKRCKEIDLHHWLSGAYRLPGRPFSEDNEDS
ncbi:DNA gyrase inhibitor YacG [Bartonella sp. DGB2]|uniref:DNA gyrase inhibitor YacG n=1 Tax=Bartonella sp. DGB2 TaxID=3388426 RepID=UPI00398F9E16